MARGVGGHGPANIMKHLRGIHFPINKQEIIDHARHGPGPDTEEVLQVLNQIKEKEYRSSADVMHEVGQST